MTIKEIMEIYNQKTTAHNNYIAEIENVMQQSRECIEELRQKETQAFNTIQPAEFKRIQSEKATEEATIAMCEKRLKELRNERLFTDNELKDYVQQIHEEIERNDAAAVKIVKKFLADMEKLGEEATEARARGNELILKIESKALPIEKLNSSVYQNAHFGSNIYKGLPKAQALYQSVKNQYMLNECKAEE